MPTVRCLQLNVQPIPDVVIQALGRITLNSTLTQTLTLSLIQAPGRHWENTKVCRWFDDSTGEAIPKAETQP